MKRKKAGLLSLRCHPCDRWWICSNMRHNCISLTIAICLLLFPFSLLLFPLLVSSQKKEIDRNLSYYIARKGQDTNWTREPCFYSFIYSCMSLKEWNATVGHSTTFSLSCPSRFFSVFIPLFSSYSFIFPVLWNNLGLLRFLWKSQITWGEKEEDERALLNCSYVDSPPHGFSWTSNCPLTRSRLSYWTWACI